MNRTEIRRGKLLYHLTVPVCGTRRCMTGHQNMADYDQQRYQAARRMPQEGQDIYARSKRLCFWNVKTVS